VITLAIIAVIFLALRRWLDVGIVIVAAAVSDETSYLFNQWVKRPRPRGHHLHILEKIQHFYSFPSGHVVHATVVFGLFLYLTTQVRRPIHPLLIWLIRLLLVALIVLMPVSRMLEGEHWPSDVLGGLLYGAIALMIFTHIYIWMRHRWPRLLARDER
jgi:membrane-associated phospholipid phosphatase